MNHIESGVGNPARRNRRNFQAIALPILGPPIDVIRPVCDSHSRLRYAVLVQ
jgi:hypothetical protein